MGVYGQGPDLHSLVQAPESGFCCLKRIIFRYCGALWYKSLSALPPGYKKGGSAGGDLVCMPPNEATIMLKSSAYGQFEGVQLRNPLIFPQSAAISAKIRRDICQSQMPYLPRISCGTCRSCKCRFSLYRPFGLRMKVVLTSACMNLKKQTKNKAALGTYDS